MIAHGCGGWGHLQLSAASRPSSTPARPYIVPKIGPIPHACRHGKIMNTVATVYGVQGQYHYAALCTFVQWAHGMLPDVLASTVCWRNECLVMWCHRVILASNVGLNHA